MRCNIVAPARQDFSVNTAMGSVRRRAAALALVLIVGLVGACSDEDRNDIERVADSAGARSVAEALRVSLLAQDLRDDQHVDDVSIIQAAVDDLPGDPEVSGVEDADGDGRDDDGKIGVRVDDEAACVTVHANGEVNVSGDAC
jgi:hypothetical protein